MYSEMQRAKAAEAAVWWFFTCLSWNMDLKAASGLYLLNVVFTLSLTFSHLRR